MSFVVFSKSFFAAALADCDCTEAVLLGSSSNVESAVASEDADCEVFKVIIAEDFLNVLFCYHDEFGYPKISSKRPDSIAVLISLAILLPVLIGTSYLSAVYGEPSVYGLVPATIRAEISKT